MVASLVLAATCGQFASAQSPTFAVAAPPQPQAIQLVLVQQAPALQPAPQVLVHKPPLWDRALERLGHALVARSAAHQHPTAMRLAVLTPATATVQQSAPPVTLGAPIPRPTPSAQSEGPATPPPSVIRSDTLLLVPDPAREDAVRRIFGR